MEIINFIENHWKLISFFITEIGFFIVFAFAMIQAVKCLLRNDLVSVFDRCKEPKKITYYQLQTMEHTYKLYKILKGNSFVDELMERVKDFEIID